MNYTNILKRAWDILWSYRALWIFGFLLALTTSSGLNNNSRYQISDRDFQSNFNITPPSEVRTEIQRFVQLIRRIFNPENFNEFIWVVIGIVAVILIMVLISRVLYYLSETAMIRMVDGYEESGEKVSWKQGFRLGWSRYAWQLFLINLLIYLPFVIVALGFIGCAAMPMIISVVSRRSVNAPSVITTVGLSFLVLFILGLIAIALSLFVEIIRRECVLKDKGVIGSIREGWKKVTQNFKDVILMWFILIGVRVGYYILSIPVILLMLGIGLLFGGTFGLAGFLIGKTASLLTGWIVAALVGGSVFLIVFSLPLLFLSGLRETYISTTWTLTFRELNLIVQNKEKFLETQAQELNLDSGELPPAI